MKITPNDAWQPSGKTRGGGTALRHAAARGNAAHWFRHLGAQGQWDGTSRPCAAIPVNGERRSHALLRPTRVDAPPQNVVRDSDSGGLRQLRVVALTTSDAGGGGRPLHPMPRHPPPCPAAPCARARWSLVPVGTSVGGVTTRGRLGLRFSARVLQRHQAPRVARPACAAPAVTSLPHGPLRPAGDHRDSPPVVVEGDHLRPQLRPLVDPARNSARRRGCRARCTLVPAPGVPPGIRLPHLVKICLRRVGRVLVCACRCLGREGTRHVPT